MKTIGSIIIGLLFAIAGIGQNLKSDSELKSILPTHIKGCTLVGEKDGMIIKMDEVSFSNASAIYKNSKVNIEIIIMDYFGSSELFTSGTDVMDSNEDYQSKDVFAKHIELDGKKGFIYGDKKSNSTVLIITWEERYVVNISVKGKMDEVYVKAIYKGIDWSSL